MVFMLLGAQGRSGCSAPALSYLEMSVGDEALTAERVSGSYLGHVRVWGGLGAPPTLCFSVQEQPARVWGGLGASPTLCLPKCRNSPPESEVGWGRPHSVPLSAGAARLSLRWAGGTPHSVPLSAGTARPFPSFFLALLLPIAWEGSGCLNN